VRRAVPLRPRADVFAGLYRRVPYTEGLVLTDAGIRLDNLRPRADRRALFPHKREGRLCDRRRGCGLVLAHKAEDEGVACAEIIAWAI